MEKILFDIYEESLTMAEIHLLRITRYFEFPVICLLMIVKKVLSPGQNKAALFPRKYKLVGVLAWQNHKYQRL